MLAWMDREKRKSLAHIEIRIPQCSETEQSLHLLHYSAPAPPYSFILQSVLGHVQRFFRSHFSTGCKISASAFYFQYPLFSVTMQISCLRLLNLLKTTGHVMHQQFNIQQLYVLPTLLLCVLCLTDNKQRLVPLTA